MTLASTGTGERQLFVSYISEVPVWKTTYRLVLSEQIRRRSPCCKAGPSWTTRWERTGTTSSSSLVAGAPQSFIQQLSQPYYGRRAIVALPQEYDTVPQTHEASLLGGAQIAGRVTDQSGGVIATRRCACWTKRAERSRRTTSDERGEYGFSSLPDGVVSSSNLRRRGFKTLVMNNAQIRSRDGSELTPRCSRARYRRLLR